MQPEADAIRSGRRLELAKRVLGHKPNLEQGG